LRGLRSSKFSIMSILRAGENLTITTTEQYWRLLVGTHPCT